MSSENVYPQVSVIIKRAGRWWPCSHLSLVMMSLKESAQLCIFLFYRTFYDGSPKVPPMLGTPKEFMEKPPGCIHYPRNV